MTEALRTQIKLKNSMHKDYLKSNNIEVLKSYRDTKRILHSSLRNAEIKYFGDQLELNSNDIFKTWKVLKTILALNNTSHKKELSVTIDNHPVSNRKYIANGFNDFFVSIGPKLAKDIHSNITPPPPPMFII